jgi:arginase
VEPQNNSAAANDKIFALVSVPLWYGAGKPGTEHGPSALKDFGLDEKLRTQGIRNVGWYQVESERIKSSESAKSNYETEVLYTLKNVFRMVMGLLTQGYKPIVIGGDHSVSIGSIAAQAIFAGAGRKVGVIWIDAHGDVHTPETSPSGHIHGMPLAVLLGYGNEKFIDIGGLFGVKTYYRNVVHIGGNSLEDAEIDFFAKHKIPFFSKKEIDTGDGFARACKAISDLAAQVETIVISVDMDAFDKKDAPGVHFQNDDGIEREKALTLFMHIKAHCRDIGGVDIAEIVPDNDVENKTILFAHDILVRLLAP